MLFAASLFFTYYPFALSFSILGQGSSASDAFFALGVYLLLLVLFLLFVCWLCWQDEALTSVDWPFESVS